MSMGVFDAMPDEVYTVPAELWEPVRAGDEHGAGKLTWPGPAIPLNVVAYQMTQKERENHQIDESVIAWMIIVDYNAWMTALADKAVNVNWRITFGGNILRIAGRAQDINVQHVAWKIPAQQIG